MKIACLIVLAIQCLAVFWWHDTELMGICAGTAILLLLVRPFYGRR
jgi:branched-subunit amino acid transport protein AzlD